MAMVAICSPGNVLAGGDSDVVFSNNSANIGGQKLAFVLAYSVVKYSAVNLKYGRVLAQFNVAGADLG